MGVFPTRAQMDTVKSEDPWYLNYRPDTLYGWYDGANLGGCRFDRFPRRDITLHEPFLVPYKTVSEIKVYGVALTMDSIIDPDFQTYIDFYAVLYEKDKKDDSNLFVLVDAIRCDTVFESIGRSPVRMATFEYDCDSVDSTWYSPSFEAYFKKPLHYRAGDSIFVGCHSLGYYHRVIGHFLNRNDSVEGRFIYLETSQTLPSDPQQAVFRSCTYYCLGGGLYGLFFPIIELRCTVPRHWRLDSAGVDSAVFAWQRHDDAYAWELQAVDGVDDLIHLIDDPEQTSYTLPLEAGRSYSVRLRKLSRYITEGYDTIVRSEWTDPIAVAGPSASVVEEQATDNTVSLSPNPANTQVTVLSPAGIRQVRVFDIAGRKVYEYVAGNPDLQSPTTVVVPIANWPDGTYTVHVDTPLGLAVKKLEKVE